MRVMVSPVVCPRLFWTTLTFRALHGDRIVSTPRETFVEEDKHKTTQKIVTHVSVHTLTFHETHYPLPPRGNPNAIQYLIPGRATNVELLKQVKNWQSPSRERWSNSLTNSRETTKGQTNYYSGRQEDNSKTTCHIPRVPLEWQSWKNTLLCSCSRVP